MNQSETTPLANLLREVAKDRQRIKQLTNVTNKLRNAIKGIRTKIESNENMIFAEYQPTERTTEECTVKQLDLFSNTEID